MNARIRRLAAISLLAASAIGASASPVFAKDNFKSFSLKTTDGSKKSLKDFLGTATLVTFFFPTCKYCNEEFPYLQELYDRYREKGLNAVAINILEEETPLVPGWQQEHKYTIPVLLGMRLDKAQKDYRVDMTPTHYLLGPKGEVILKQDGYKPGDEKALEETIQKTIAP